MQIIPERFTESFSNEKITDNDFIANTWKLAGA